MIVAPQWQPPQEAPSNVLQFTQRNRHSIAGGFWARPIWLQDQRIRELARARLSIEYIAELVRLPVGTVRNIVEGHS